MTDTAKQEFAELLRKYRRQAGFKSLQDFATAVSVERTTIWRAENKDLEKVPPPDTFLRMKEELSKGDPRGRPCTEKELEQLDEAWQRARQAGGERNRVSNDPTLQTVVSALDAWPGSSAERAAIVDELRFVAGNWLSFRSAVNELSKGGMYPFARETLERLRTRVDGQPRLKMRVLDELAYARRYFGETKAAIDEELSEALTIARQLDPSELEEHASILISMGDFHRRLGELADAFARYEQSTSVFKRIPEEHLRWRGIATVDRKLASIWLFRGEPSKAAEQCRRSLQLCRELGDLDGLRKGEQHLAWALALLGSYAQALELHRGVLTRIETETAKPTPLTDVAKAKRYFADVLRMSGQYDEALSAYLEALDDLREYRRYSDSSPIEEETLVRGPILLGQGQTYARMGRLQEASAMLAESERANADDPFFLAQTHVELGRLATETGNYEQAARRFDRAASLFGRSGNVYYQAAIQVNRAELEYRTGEPAGVRRWAQEVTQHTTDNNIKVHRIRAHVWLAIADMTEGHAADPTVELFVALRMAVEDLDNPYLCREILKRYQDQMLQLNNGRDSWKFRELCTHIERGLAGIRTHNRAIQAVLDEWRKEVNVLCGGQT